MTKLISKIGKALGARLIFTEKKSVLKQDAVIEYLNELLKMYVFVSIGEAANSSANMSLLF